MPRIPFVAHRQGTAHILAEAIDYARQAAWVGLPSFASRPGDEPVPVEPVRGVTPHAEAPPSRRYESRQPAPELE